MLTEERHFIFSGSKMLVGKGSVRSRDKILHIEKTGSFTCKTVLAGEFTNAGSHHSMQGSPTMDHLGAVGAAGRGCNPLGGMESMLIGSEFWLRCLVTVW